MFQQHFKAHMDCFARMAPLEGLILEAGRNLGQTLKNGKKILLCGNGGSAADAQHFAAEVVGRFVRERKAWPAIALTTDSSIVSAVANDYGYDTVFERQVEAYGKPGDMLIGISTSGNSLNVKKAVVKARELSMQTLALTGGDGGAMARLADKSLVAPASETARIQEIHIFILHLWADMIEWIITEDDRQYAGIS